MTASATGWPALFRDAFRRSLNPMALTDANRVLTANGFLTVDGRVIYQMTDFTLE